MAQACAEVERIWKVRARPFPALAPKTEPEPEFDTDNTRDSETTEDGTPEDVFEEGNHLFYMKLPTEAEFIWATQTTLYRLAEAAQKNIRAQVKILEYLWEFKDVFAKDSFDTLLDRKVWDHAIELMSGSTPKNCKVYPLSQNEQEELDAFIQENLNTGRI